MKSTKRIAAITAVVTAAATTPALSQVSEDGMGKIVPVELYACSYVDGKGRGDLEAVVAQWNAFMDERKSSTYAAWLLTPHYFGAGQDYDMLWMGAYTDGEAMGLGEHAWISEGGATAAAFQEVMACSAHVGLASAMYKSPPAGATPESSIMAMSDCEMNEGTRYSDIRNAELEWAAYQTEQGMEHGTWHWFPTFGGGDQDYDYKLMNAYEDFTQLGKEWEQRANGGGRAVSQDVFGDLDDCDDSRVYIATSIRAAQLRK